MQPVYFEGSTEIQATHIVTGLDSENQTYYLTAWKPSYEDLQALNRGEPVYVKTLSESLPPMALFTLDEK